MTMKTVCEYHPTRPAEWNCPECNDSFCADCVDTRVVEQYGKKERWHFCPKCNVQVNRLAFENTVETFWNRLPRFFVYPFHPRPLLLMAALAVASVLFSGPGLIMMLIRFAIWAVILKYSFAALKSTANGKLIPPKVNLQTISDDFEVVFKQIGIYVIIGFAFFKVAQIAGIVVGLLFLSVAILSIPAMVIVLVATNSLLHAINPMIFARMAWRIGWGYLLMCIFLALLGAAPAVLGRYIIVFLPDILHGFLFTMAKSFYTIISYHLMGYVIFQYHEEIGYEVDLDEEEASLDKTTPEQNVENELLNKIDILVKEGKLDEAISLIKDETGGVISDLNLAERYFNLLKIKQLTPEMLKHGEVYLELLAKEDQRDKLCEVYLECISKKPELTISSSTTFKVASCLNEAGNPKGAIVAYNRFIKANPKNPLIPKAYFLAANVINEKLKNPRKAIGILKGLIKTYPNHEIVPYVQNYIKQMSIS